MKVADTHLNAAVKNVVKKYGSKETHVDTDTDALRKGVEFEAEAARFYEEVANASEDPAEINFFRYLAKIELQHMNSIKDALLYLEDPSGWQTLHEEQEDG